VAGVLVYIECDRDQPLAGSLEALGEGRRIASSLGATLCAFAPLAAEAQRQSRIAALARAGADRVLTMTAPELAPPGTWSSQGVALHAACQRERPMLVLLAATDHGRDLGARLAARLGAAFVPDASIERGPRGEVVFTRNLYGGQFRRRLAGEQLGAPVIVTIAPGSYAVARGCADDAHTVALEPPAFPAAARALSTEPSPGAPLARARIIVAAGGGVSRPGQLAMLERLAVALGGALGATRTLRARGGPALPPEIGVGGHIVAPRLYIACAASGSLEHLGAVSPDAELVAINTDRHAPIFDVASYGLVADIDDVVPEMLAALGQPERMAATP
jgi:electron transfer flavoprotein alpha subunit